MVTLQSLGIDLLGRDEQVALFESLERHLLDTVPYTGLSPEHLADLQRRLDEDDANPEEGIPWEVVKREARERIANRVAQ